MKRYTQPSRVVPPRVVRTRSFTPLPATTPAGTPASLGASRPVSRAMNAISSSASTFGFASAPVKVPASAYTVVVKFTLWALL